MRARARPGKRRTRATLFSIGRRAWKWRRYAAGAASGAGRTGCTYGLGACRLCAGRAILPASEARLCRRPAKIRMSLALELGRGVAALGIALAPEPSTQGLELSASGGLVPPSARLHATLERTPSGAEQTLGASETVEQPSSLVHQQARRHIPVQQMVVGVQQKLRGGEAGRRGWLAAGRDM